MKKFLRIPIIFREKKKLEKSRKTKSLSRIPGGNSSQIFRIKFKAKNSSEIPHEHYLEFNAKFQDVFTWEFNMEFHLEFQNEIPS